MWSPNKSVSIITSIKHFRWSIITWKEGYNNWILTWNLLQRVKEIKNQIKKGLTNLPWREFGIGLRLRPDPPNQDFLPTIP